jgi:hypothetical protein
MATQSTPADDFDFVTILVMCILHTGKEGVLLDFFYPARAAAEALFRVLGQQA